MSDGVSNEVPSEASIYDFYIEIKLLSQVMSPTHAQ